MMIRDKIKQICVDRGITQKKLAEIHGDIYQTFKNKLGRNTMKYAEVEKLMDELGCDIVFVDRNSKKVY